MDPYTGQPGEGLLVEEGAEAGKFFSWEELRNLSDYFAGPQQVRSFAGARN